MADSLQELLDMINNPEFKMFDQWQVQKLAVVQVWADVYSKLTDRLAKNAMLIPTKNIEETLENLKENYGESMAVVVLPLGPLTIPYVEEKVASRG